MPDSTGKLLWIDLETTGLDPKDGVILEIGMILTDMVYLETIATENFVLPWNAIKVEGMCESFVRRMHSDNELFYEANREYVHYADAGLPIMPYERASLCFRNFFQDYGIGKVYPAGSSVHFDMKWLASVPALSWIPESLHHRHFDVSSIKMFVGPHQGIDYEPGPVDNHRALDDLKNDIDWLKTWRLKNAIHGSLALAQEPLDMIEREAFPGEFPS